MKATRIDEIEQYITENRSVSLEELCERFSISKSTVRRDIDELAASGKVEKVYGGVRAPEQSTSVTTLLPFEERDIANHEEKQYICGKAAGLVSPHDVIFIDTGTTCIHMVEYLRDIPCTVITNSLNVALKAIPYENIGVMILPGRLNRKTWSFAGRDIEDHLASLNIRKDFMATSVVSVRGGLTNASEDEYSVKKSICRSSSSIYLLADHDKFGRVALYTYSSLDSISGLVTDRRPPDEYVTFCADSNIQLIY